MRLVTQPMDLAAVLSQFEEPWSPRTVATLNDYDLRVVKAQGEFTRHSHPDTDEVFLVLAGSLTIRLDDSQLTLGSGQLYVVPRGVYHRRSLRTARRFCSSSPATPSTPGTRPAS